MQQFFLKYAIRNKTQHAVKICGIMPCSHICIKPTYENGESGSLCGKICNMHTFVKYANNAVITYSHKAGMPTTLMHNAPVRIVNHVTHLPTKSRTAPQFHIIQPKGSGD